MSRHQPHQRPVFIQRRWSCVYGGIGREFSITSSFWKTKQIQRVLLPIRPTESSTQQKASRISQQKTHIHQDNARSRVSVTPRQKLLQFDWKVLIHLPYTPDTALLGVHLFQSLEINGKTFNSLEDCIRHLEQLFAQKDTKFWEDGFMKLPEKNGRR